VRERTYPFGTHGVVVEERVIFSEPTNRPGKNFVGFFFEFESFASLRMVEDKRWHLVEPFDFLVEELLDGPSDLVLEFSSVAGNLVCEL